ncbi:stage III sporulation protein AF [Paenibacillus mucilaginosus]|uniref:stage III sporulation protein AF n=1 Tax=Paenibacillus mucilaginosus TaxID=61624 RepID=UPI003D1F4ACA
MDWLSDWLRSIILVILLATFVDLLLPNAAMQRYVRTVISLFLLLTLLQPLFTLFSGRGELNGRLTAALFEQNGPGSAGESLAAIQTRAETLKRSQEQEAHKLVRQQVAELMKRKLESASGVEVRSIRVETEAGADGQAVIKSVFVTIDPEPARPAGGSAGGEAPQRAGSEAMKPVEPVEPVKSVSIRIGAEEAGAKEVSRMGESAARELTPQQLQKKTEITRLFAADWQLEESQIQLELIHEPKGR